MKERASESVDAKLKKLSLLARELCDGAHFRYGRRRDTFSGALVPENPWYRLCVEVWLRADSVLRNGNSRLNSPIPL